jgi:hypothetical protein
MFLTKLKHCLKEIIQQQQQQQQLLLLSLLPRCHFLSLLKLSQLSFLP